MSGNKIGGLKARDKNLLSDPDFYVKIGSRGGKAGFGHKFGHGKVDPRLAGAIGGAKSRRGKSRPKSEIQQIDDAMAAHKEDKRFINKLRRFWNGR